MAILQRTIANLELGVAGLLTGTSLFSVTNLYGALQRAFLTFSQKCSIPESMTSQSITLYDGVTDYTAVSPIFGSTIKDLRPVGIDRQSVDFAIRQGIEDFDRNKAWRNEGYKITFETRAGINIMRIKSRFPVNKLVLDPMNQISDNSSGNNQWTPGGLVTNLAQDTSVYYKGPASLRFSISGAGVGNLAKTLDNAIDMTIYQNVALLFLELNLPTLNLTNVVLHLGSDSSNYYSVTATQGQLGAWTTGSFLDTPFDLSTATIVGTPVITKIQYVNLIFTTSGAITNIRCGYLFASLPSQNQILFTTTGIYQNQSGVISNFITNDNDLILLSDAAYNLYEHECALAVGLQNGASMTNATLSRIDALLNGSYTRTGKVITSGLYDKYRAENPSENITQVGNWYND